MGRAALDLGIPLLSGGKDGKGSKVSLNGSVGGGITGASQQSLDKSSTMSESERINQGLEFLNSEARSSAANNTRESFFRAAATSGDSRLEGLTQRRDASLLDRVEVGTIGREEQ